MITKGSSSLPHPVLGIEDDMKGKFSVTCIPRISRETRELVLDGTTYSIENDYINDLVQSGAAKVLMNVRCPSTMRSWSTDCSEPARIFEHEICDFIDVEVLIVASTHIADFSHQSFNPIFEGVNFEIEVGDIIGIAGNSRIELPRQNEKLGMMTMFEFIAIEHGGVISIDAGNDRIKIRYPCEIDGTSQLKVMFSKAPWNAFHIFILPAIEAALYLICKDRAEAEEYAWYSVLSNLLGGEEINLLESEIHIQAQRIAMKFLDGLNPMHEAAKELNPKTY